MEKELTNPNFREMEKQTLKEWNESDIFKLMKEKNENSEKHFRFLDGPITANYDMGVHHAWGRTLKDIVLKYKTLQGYSANYINGFDAHGLPVETGVEKQLGVNSKKEILEIGIDNFVEACLERVRKYSGIQTEQSKILGQIMDWDNSYYTNSDTNIEAIWYFLKKCDDRNMITKDYKPMQWCSRCGTSLSEHEMTGSYKDVTHTAVFIKLPIKDSNDRILVWTTTPWTLSSNVAVAVNPENDYLRVRVKSDSSTFILGKEAKKVLKDDIVEIVDEFKGSELVGKEYETCFPELEKQQFAHKIVAWSDVAATEGSGAVHIAPGCGKEDYELGEKLGLPKIMPVDESGVFTKEFGFMAGKNTNEVKEMVFDRLKQDNKLYYTHPIKHSYPICWRCKEEIIFRLADAWYLKVDGVRQELKQATDTVKWEPDFMGKRMHDWLDNMGDWNISRSRFYGVPLPIYPCECGHVHVVGSREELIQLSSKEEVDALPHIHRPHIDKIKITCPKCGRKVQRIPEVGDCWLDAGITPFSTQKYFEDKEYFKKNFPIECVIEMREQIRLWFYSLLFMSVILEGKAPYEKVVAYESVVKEDGSRFSKSGFNIVLQDAVEKMNADTIRYLFAGNPLTSDVRFGFNLGEEVKRKLINFWNIYSFFVTYASIDNPDLKNFKPNYESLGVSDKWLLARVNEFVKNSKENYDNYSAYLVVKDFEKLVDDVSNFYIRTNRRRFWKSGDEEDKLCAYYALEQCIKNMVIVMSPIIPFLTDYIYKKLVNEFEDNAPKFVLLADFPKENEEWDNKEIIVASQIARDIITSALSLRNENQIKIKQPLKTLYVFLSNEERNAIDYFGDIIKDELNIKQIIIEDDEEKFNTPKLSINFKKAGAVLKGDVQKVKNILQNATSEEMAEYVKGFNEGNINIGEYQNLQSDLFIKEYAPKQDYVISHENGKTLVLDITIDKNLLLEGLCRELIRNIQILRKEADFLIEQRIKISFNTDSELLKETIEKFNDKITQEILAVENCESLENIDIQKEIEISEEKVVISLMKC